MVYRFRTQLEGVLFLKGLGVDVAREEHGMKHTFTGETPEGRLYVSVPRNGEMSLVDKDEPELKKYHDPIEIALNERFMN
jgi:hypothetical protein